MRLRDFKVLTFDCYGTLIDWETGLAAALAPLLARAGLGAPDGLAAFAEEEAAQQAATPAMRYADLLAAVHQRLARRWGLAADATEAARFAASIGDWPAFPDSPAALAYLKRHYALVVLSNVDRRSFAPSGHRLGVAFDAVYTAEEIGSYKPDPRNFAYLLARLGERGYERGDILHVAQSLFHDHAPANALGLASAWIDRRGGAAGGATKPPPAGVRWDFRFPDLAAFAAAHRSEAG